MQLNSAGRPVELSCVAVNGALHRASVRACVRARVRSSCFNGLSLDTDELIACISSTSALPSRRPTLVPGH